jgi:hypothetical protein
LLAILVTLAAGLCPASAAAQESRSSIDVARSHMEQGQIYYLQGRFGEAAAEFEAAYAAEPFSAFLYNAAVAYENGGDLDRAIEFFRRYLERDPSASDRAAVEARMGRLRAAIEARRVAASPDRSGEGGEAGAAGGGGAAGEAGAAGDAGAAGQGGAAGEAGAAGGGGGGEAPTPGGAGAAPVTPPSALPEDFKSLVSVRTTPGDATVVITDASGREVATGRAPWAHTLERGSYRVRIQHPDFNVAEQAIEIEPGTVYVVVVNLSQGEFFGYLRVFSTPPGANVYIDEREVGARGQTPFEGPITVGTHRLWIEREGYQPMEQEFEVGLAERRDIRVELERVPYGRIRVTGNVRGARVFVDDREVGAVPWEGNVDAGERRVRVEASGMKSWERRVTVQRGQVTPVRVRLREAVGRGGAIVSFFLAAVLAGGGAVMAVLADDLRATLAAEHQAGRLATADERIDRGFFLSLGADGAFGLAGIVAFAGLYYAFYDPLPPSEGTVFEPRDWAFAPFVDPRFNAIGGTLGGRF